MEDIQSIKDKLYSLLPPIEANKADKPGTRSLEGQALAKYFDHTLLKQTTEEKDINLLCREAIEHDVFSVCVPPNRVGHARSFLQQSTVKVCTVLSFPLGYDSSADKVQQCKRVINDGAEEVDMVMSIGCLKEKNYRGVFDDIQAVVNAAADVLVKVILETCLLTAEEKIMASLISIAAGADMLKTSTGFSTAGATLEDIALMRRIAGDTVGVKASGGIRDPGFVHKCIEAGADRIGTSSTVAILIEV